MDLAANIVTVPLTARFLLCGSRRRLDAWRKEKACDVMCRPDGQQGKEDIWESACMGGNSLKPG